MYIIMSSANNESFTYFSIPIPFISSYSLISIARTFKTMLNNCGENGHPCLVPELRGNALSFSNIENNVCCGLFIYGLYYTEVGSLYAHFLNHFYHKWVLIFFSKAFSASIEMIVWFLCFNLLVWCITLIACIC